MVPKRKLGSQGLEVSAIGLGCMGMSHNYLGADEQKSQEAINRAIDLECNFIDTAENYGPFKNEVLVGKALRKKRGRVILATKVGFQFEGDKCTGINCRPEHIKQAFDGCLKRLGTDYVDLLYQHRVDPDVPIEDVAGTIGDIIQAGKARFFGLSEAGVEIIQRAHKEFPVSALQSEYSLWERNLEPDIIPLLKELGIGLVPFGPLGKNFLAGSAKKAEEYPEGDMRRNGDPRIQEENFDNNMKTVEQLKDFASDKNITPAQAALAWILNKDEQFVPIPGTTSITHLEENLAAASVALSQEDIQSLDQIFAPEHISGNRYMPNLQALVNR
ncbi:MAG: aldo/keto reductase [Fibrobacteria bacterium]|nr:aldo/keto reductase [Fibrobacteria bacterium]